MPNQVTYRVYDFLKEIEPFTFLDQAALLRVAERVEVRYQPPGTVVFRPGEPPRDRFFVVKEGTVELYSEDEVGQELLVERCGERELFGIRPLLAEDTYLFLARATEETLLYAINSAGFREIISGYPRVLEYLATSMAGSSRYALEYRAARRADERTPTPDAPDLLALQSVQQARDPVVCHPTDTIIAAAKKMTEYEVGSIIVVDDAMLP